MRPGQDTDRPTPYRMILDETSDLDMPDRSVDKLVLQQNNWLGDNDDGPSLMESNSKLCTFSVGEKLEVYRATLGHKVF